MSVEIIMLTILNFRPSNDINPSIHTHDIAIGRKEKSVNSILPYPISSAKNTISVEYSAMLLKSLFKTFTSCAALCCLSVTVTLFCLERLQILLSGAPAVLL